MDGIEDNEGYNGGFRQGLILECETDCMKEYVYAITGYYGKTKASEPCIVLLKSILSSCFGHSTFVMVEDRLDGRCKEIWSNVENDVNMSTCQHEQCCIDNAGQ